jgi:hypothetical protein
VRRDDLGISDDDPDPRNRSGIERSTKADRIRAQADVAREVHASQQLSGSSTVANTRRFDVRRVVERDRFGRLRIRWDKVGEEGL